MADLNTVIPFLNDVDLNNRELLRVKLDMTYTPDEEARIGYHLGNHRPTYYNGTTLLEIASLTGVETFTNKTLTAPVINTSITGTAIKTYAGGIATSLGTASETHAVTEKYVIGAVEAGISANDAMMFKGGIDASSNPNYPAADAGHTYRITVGGRIGGAAGIVVEAGDMIICAVDGTTSGNQATVGSNWVVIQYNIDILPATRGGTGQSTYIVGDTLYADSASTLARLGIGTPGQVLTVSAGNLPIWANTQAVITTFIGLSDTPSSYSGSAGRGVKVNTAGDGLEFYVLPTSDNYGHWLVQVGGGTAVQVTSGYAVDFVPGTGLASSIATVAGKSTITHGLANMAAYSLKGNNTNASAAPTDILLNSTNAVLGRLAAGIVNIPFGTAANTVAWGNHTHSDLHTRKHNITSTDDHEITESVTTGHVLTVIDGANKTFAWSAPVAVAHPLTPTNNTVSGLTAGRVLRATAATTYDWSTTIWPNALTINNILYASAANTVSGLATANNGILVTNGSGVPSIGTDIPTAVTIGGAYIYRAGGTDVAVGDGGTGMSTYAQGDLIYASASNTLARLAKSTTANSFLKNSGTNNNPAWAVLTFNDLPTGTSKFYTHSYDSTQNGSGVAITTLTITAGTHNCGATPMVLFYRSKDANTWEFVPASVKISKQAGTIGDVTISTAVATTGKIIIIGA